MAAELLSETERFLHAQIPLARAMQAHLERDDESGLLLSAPLAPNHNHLGTAFGGSLSALATLAGYSLLWLALGERDSHIVIRSSSIRYFHPVTGPLRAFCHRPSEGQLASFRRRFAKLGKARLKLKVTIEEDDRTCVVFEAIYVAIR